VNRRAATLLTGLSLLLLPGCYADVESFAVASAKQECKRIAECDRSRFVDQYRDDMGRCRTEVEDTILDSADIAEEFGWEYDQENGQRCIETQRELRNDCSDDATREIDDDCLDVLFDGF